MTAFGATLDDFAGTNGFTAKNCPAAPSTSPATPLVVECSGGTIGPGQEATLTYTFYYTSGSGYSGVSIVVDPNDQLGLTNWPGTEDAVVAEDITGQG
jgi:hypothetical protein